jgi:hypothetical protein
MLLLILRRPAEEGVYVSSRLLARMGSMALILASLEACKKYANEGKAAKLIHYIPRFLNL